MDECLAYFRDALHRPEQAQGWDEWWAAHEPLVRTSFTPLDYTRLKVRRLVAAHELLTRLGALSDPPPPVRLDLAFLDTIRSVRWFERCGAECRVVVPFGTERVASWAEAQAACGSDDWSNTQLEIRSALTLFLDNNHGARYQRWNDIVGAARAACVAALTEEVWRPFCERNGLSSAVVQAVQLDVLAAILAHEYGDCSGRPAFALHVFNIYRAGHFPCGWQGEWPEGRLLVL